METLVVRTKGMIVVSSIASIILGILFLAEPVLSGLTFGYFIGAMFVIGGIARVVLCIGQSQNNGGSLVGGLLMLLIGALCISNPSAIASFIAIITGLFVVADGAMGISAGSACMRAKVGGGVFIIIMSAILIVCGVYIMFAPFGFIMIVAGISLIVDGVFSIAFAGKLGKMVHDAKISLQ